MAKSPRTNGFMRVGAKVGMWVGYHRVGLKVITGLGVGGRIHGLGVGNLVVGLEDVGDIQ